MHPAFQVEFVTRRICLGKKCNTHHVQTVFAGMKIDTLSRTIVRLTERNEQLQGSRSINDFPVLFSFSFNCSTHATFPFICFQGKAETNLLIAKRRPAIQQGIKEIKLFFARKSNIDSLGLGSNCYNIKPKSLACNLFPAIKLSKLSL